jgi:myo-inositol-1(or 4)-monophosphatase
MLEFATDLARQAGALLREAYARGPARINSKQSAVDLVTEVDLASEKLIVEAIQRRFPDHAICGEESPRALPRTGPAWLVDPLDGTTNFAHGVPVFCVTLAFIQDWQVVAGVTHDPLRDETFAAERGQGAWCNGRRLQVSSATKLGDSLLATGFAYDRATNPDNNLAEFGYFMPRVRGLRRAGAAGLDLAWLAAGRLDGYWEQRLQPWDYAAGSVLVAEAGGRATTYSGQPWQIHHGHMLASNGVPSLHEALMAGLRTARQGLPEPA